MQRIIGIDFDGTLANTGLIKSRYLLERHGVVVNPAGCNRTHYLPFIGAAAYKQMAELIYGRESTLSTPVVDGASEALEELSRHARLYVITARTKSRAAVVSDWLALNGMEHLISQVCHLTEGESKADICRSIGAGVLIDDDVRHLADDAVCRQLILFGSDKPVPGTRVIPAKTWPDVVSLVISISVTDLSCRKD